MIMQKATEGIVYWSIASVIALVVSVIAIVIAQLVIVVVHDQDVAAIDKRLKECIDEQRK